MNRNPNPNL